MANAFEPGCYGEKSSRTILGTVKGVVTHMPDSLHGAVLNVQRLVLERLIELTAEQSQALDAGDLSRLMNLSQSRSRLVQESAAYLPPQQAWDSTLSDLVTQSQQHSDQLQQVLRASMAAIRRELVDLTGREKRVVNYLAHTSVPEGTHWKA